MAAMLGCMDLMRRVWLGSLIAFNEAESNTKSTITNITSIYALEPKQEAKKVGAPGSEGQCVGTKEETKETKAAEAQEIKPEATTDGAATPPPNKKSITPPPAMESNGPKEE
jgi:delta 1-pyrroline-5-carboxylate dehydrogenase